MTIEKIKKFIATCEKISKGEVKYCSYELIERAEEIARELKDRIEDEEEREETAAFSDILK